MGDEARRAPPDAAISACKAPGRLGRRMLRIRPLRSTRLRAWTG